MGGRIFFRKIFRPFFLAESIYKGGEEIEEIYKSNISKSSKFSDPPGPDLNVEERSCFWIEDLRTDTMCETNDDLSAGAWWVNRNMHVPRTTALVLFQM